MTRWGTVVWPGSFVALVELFQRNISSFGFMGFVSDHSDTILFDKPPRVAQTFPLRPEAGALLVDDNEVVLSPREVEQW